MIRVRAGTLLFAAAALGAIAAPAAAQRGDTLVIGLEDALDLARTHNPTYRQAVNPLDLNGPAARAVWLGEVLPRLSLNVLSTGYGGRLARRATDFFGNPIANPDAEFVYASDTQQGLGLSWALHGPSAWNRVKRLGLENGTRTLTEALAGEALRVEVRRAFFDALEQEALLGAERDVAEATRSDLEAAERLFALAVRSRVDVLQAELQIEQQALAVREQAARRDQARLTLRGALGDPELPPVRPAEVQAPVFDPVELNGEGLIAAALEAGPDVRQARAALRSAELGVAEGRAGYWPSLQASFGVGRYVQAGDGGSLFHVGGFGDALYSQFSIRLSFPFFDDLPATRLAIARAEVERENRRDGLREARLRAERATRSALVSLQGRWESLRIAARALAVAEEALELGREEYRLGGRSFEQLQQSVRTEADARRQRIRARWGFADALVDLEAAVGGPVR